MNPSIDSARFGSITIDGTVFKHDVIIRLTGEVKKRKKKLSKALYGTSHIISLAEAEHIYQKGAKRLVVGAGQFGRVKLSDEAAGYLHQLGCRVDLLPTAEAVQAWNEAEGDVIGMFHITC
jgi:hypothetical protein